MASTFFHFCPHGVCYGFHLVHRAEGRRDVVSSLWGYLQTPPDVVVYDYACGAEEAAMNRYPEFYVNVRGNIITGQNFGIAATYLRWVYKIKRTDEI